MAQHVGLHHLHDWRAAHSRSVYNRIQLKVFPQSSELKSKVQMTHSQLESRFVYVGDPAIFIIHLLLWTHMKESRVSER